MRRNGMMSMDVLAGLFLLGAMAMLLAVAANMRHRAAKYFADQSASLSAARDVLSNLQSGRQPVSTDSARVVDICRAPAGLEV